MRWIVNAWNNRPSACRRRRGEQARAYAAHGLTELDVQQLAMYNAERSRGIMHTAEHREKMADIQARFDASI